MLHYLSEDPWPLAVFLGSAALIALVALKFTQQGRYLIGAGVALALALAVLGIERAWVTDAERIEAVVYDLAGAVEASDADRVLAILAPEVSLVIGDDTLSSQLLLVLLRERLSNTQLDFVQISHLTAHAGALSRTGTAEFQARAMGSYPIQPTSTRWSLGFREVQGSWKVTRITPVNPPPEISLFFGQFGRSR